VTGSAEVAAVAARVFRDERVAVLATLIRQVGDSQLAEDSMQDAFESALATWPRDGIPRNPGAWINVTARRRAIDRLRRNRSSANRAARLAELARLDEQEHPTTSEASMIADDRLRLIFTCCHPALDPSARVALTLRTLGGLTTAEIAYAFLVAEPTMERGSPAPSARSPTRASGTRCRPTTSFPDGCGASCTSCISSSTRATRPAPASG
jgi:RNA polymerase sigma-70 factor, ECF subfamily